MVPAQKGFQHLWDFQKNTAERTWRMFENSCWIQAISLPLDPQSPENFKISPKTQGNASRCNFQKVKATILQLPNHPATNVNQQSTFQKKTKIKGNGKETEPELGERRKKRQWRSLLGTSRGFLLEETTWLSCFPKGFKQHPP